MKLRTRDLVVLFVTLSVIAGAALYAVNPPGENSVALASEGSASNVISVNGEATITVKPDTVVFTVGVTTQATTAQQAMAENAAKMDSLIAALLSAGVKKEDMKTVRFNVNPVYDYRNQGAPKLTGYQASNALQVTQPVTANIGQLIDKAASAGANTVDHVMFMVKDVKKFRDQALTEAMADARSRADVLAKSAGVAIKGVRSVSESGSSMPVRNESFNGLQLAAKTMADTQVIAGEMTLNFSVRVEYTF